MPSSEIKELMLYVMDEWTKKFSEYRDRVHSGSDPISQDKHEQCTNIILKLTDCTYRAGRGEAYPYHSLDISKEVEILGIHEHGKTANLLGGLYASISTAKRVFQVGTVDKYQSALPFLGHRTNASKLLAELKEGPLIEMVELERSNGKADGCEL